MEHDTLPTLWLHLRLPSLLLLRGSIDQADEELPWRRPFVKHCPSPPDQ